MRRETFRKFDEMVIRFRQHFILSEVFGDTVATTLTGVLLSFGILANIIGTFATLRCVQILQMVYYCFPLYLMFFDASWFIPMGSHLLLVMGGSFHHYSPANVADLKRSLRVVPLRKHLAIKILM